MTQLYHETQQASGRSGKEIPALYSISNHEMRLHLHPGQASAWMSRKRFIFMLAGTQGG